MNDDEHDITANESSSNNDEHLKQTYSNEEASSVDKKNTDQDKQVMDELYSYDTLQLESAPGIHKTKLSAPENDDISKSIFVSFCYDALLSVFF